MMNQDHVATIAPRFQRPGSQRRRVLGAAKLDMLEDQAHNTRSASTASFSSQAPQSTAAGNTKLVNSTDGPLDKDKKLEKEKDKARSDDGFRSDSDKSSNHSSASVRNISRLTRTPSVKKPDPPPRVRARSSIGSLSDVTKADKLNFATLSVTRKAEEARQKRKIADLEISIGSLMKINAELDATNKKQIVEIQELRRRLQIHEGFTPELSTSDEERSEPISESELTEMERENDVRWRKICMTMEQLVADAKAAVESTSRTTGTRVLTEAELDVTGINSRLAAGSKSPRKASSDINGRRTPSGSWRSSHGSDNQSTAAKVSKPLTGVPKRKSPSVVSDTKSAPPGRSRPSTPRPSTPRSSTSRPGTPQSGRTSRSSTPKPSLSLEVEISRENRMSPEFDMPRSESPRSLGRESPSKDPERVQAVLEELLTIAKRDFTASPTATSPRPSEPKGLGLLLTVPEPQTPPASPHVPSSRIIDSSQRSPSMTLLYELQDLLGYKERKSARSTDNFRKSMPALSGGRGAHDNVAGGSQSDRNGSDDNQRVWRRRSSPNFRTSSQPAGNSFARPGSEPKTEHSDQSATNNRASWLGSFGFLKSWRNPDV